MHRLTLDDAQTTKCIIKLLSLKPFAACFGLRAHRRRRPSVTAPSHAELMGAISTGEFHSTITSTFTLTLAAPNRTVARFAHIPNINSSFANQLFVLFRSPHFAHSFNSLVRTQSLRKKKKKTNAKGVRCGRENYYMHTKIAGIVDEKSSFFRAFYLIVRNSKFK